jgi:FlgD Ig-like domain/FG-GAP-like repeat
MTCSTLVHSPVCRLWLVLLLIAFGAIIAIAQPSYILDGGDDVVLFDDSDAWWTELEIASNGDMYALCQFDGPDGRRPFVIYRSTDSGESWGLWSDFTTNTPGRLWYNPTIHLAEGTNPRIFIAYSVWVGATGDMEMRVAWSPLGLESGDFSADSLIYTDPDGISSPSLVSDVASYDSYYLYLAFVEVDDPVGHDIFFARSTDQGDTWEPAYEIGTIGAFDDRYYSRPKVSYGFGGFIHVAWYLGFLGENELDDTIRYRRATSFAGDDIDSWGPIRSLSPSTNDEDEIFPQIAASHYSNDVVITYTRTTAGSPLYYEGIGIISSSDQGETFTPETIFSDGHLFVDQILEDTTANRWLFSTAQSSRRGYYSAPVATPTSWGELVDFADDFNNTGNVNIAFDPTHGNQVAVVFMNAQDDDNEEFRFDAAWRDGPGFPNYEDGFPIDLGFFPRTDPGLADLNGDGDLEIIFADDEARIHVYQSDGTPLPGWPVILDDSVSDSPIAVGDLAGDGEPIVVAGTESGQVYAFNADGSLRSGWPWYSGEVDPAYVAIGALGGPYARAIVACVGSRVDFLDHTGAIYPDAVARGFAGRNIVTPPAIGDLNGDGVSEVVVAAREMVYGFEMQSAVTVLVKTMPDTVSTGPCLGDFDWDDDAEVVVGLDDGTVHLLDGNGDYFPGDWPVAALDSEVTGIAIAQILGAGVPEIVVTGRRWQVNVIYADGHPHMYWPNETGDGWYLIGGPVIGALDGTGGDVITGARDGKAWAWTNMGESIPGWPKSFGNSEHVNYTPAYGDLDLDGSAEVVYLTSSQLHIVDVNNPPEFDAYTWGMAGYDKERTSCANCPVDVLAVDESEPVVTCVQFAAPTPNPIIGKATFAYAIPTRAVVELNIYDVSGRRVTTVRRSEEEAGEHVLHWDRLDGRGLPVASGQYLATLRVQGPGVRQTLSRKVTVL